MEWVSYQQGEIEHIIMIDENKSVRAVIFALNSKVIYEYWHIGKPRICFEH
jgi:hypothetical protein